MRERLELWMVAWGHFAYRHAKTVIAVVLIAAAAAASQLPKLTLDTSTENFLHETDPVRRTYDEFREQFGRDDQMVVAIEAPNVFDLEFLDRLRAMHADIENEVPNLEDVSSLINARNTRGEGDRLIVGELLAERPETTEELAEIERLVRASSTYENLYISEDARFATIMIRTNAYSSLGDAGDVLAGFDDEGGDSAEPTPRPFITTEENAAVVAAIETIRQRYDAEDFRIYLAGTPIMIEAMQGAIVRDMSLFTSLAFLVIILFLSLLFRKVSGVVLPLVTVTLSVVTTLSLMAAAGVAVNVPTQILPSFLLAVGIGHSVHLLTIFYQQTQRGVGCEDAIAFALGHSGVAILMTSLTTAGGLLSFAAAELAPIAEFGIFGPVGVIVALIFTVVLLPALIAVFPMRAEKVGAEPARDRISQRILVRAGDFANTHAPSITLVTAGLLAIALLGAFQIDFEHDPIAWFPEDDYFRISNQVVDDELRGSIFMEVLIDTHEENGLQNPELLAAMDELRRQASAYQYKDVRVGKTISLVDVVKETNQALNENRPELHTIPRDSRLVAQELLLFENSGSDDLEDLVDSSFSKGRMTFKVSMAGGTQYQTFLENMEHKSREILGDDVDITFTGIMVIIGGTINAVMHSMAKTYLIALSIITPLIVLLIGRLRIGLVAMIPNLAPIIFTLGLMGWAGIPLDAFTLLVGSIAIGLAVDDTIHFMHQFGRYFDKSGDVAYSIRETLRSTGQALLYTSLVLSAGFFIYMFATMQNLFYFGFLTGLTIILAFLADLILAPALITLVARPAERSKSEIGSTEMEATT